MNASVELKSPFPFVILPSVQYLVPIFHTTHDLLLKNWDKMPFTNSSPLSYNYLNVLGEIGLKTPRHVLAAGVNLGILEVPLLYDQQSGK